MNEQELIALIEDRLPGDLNEQEVSRIREVMRESPALRDALWRELSFEQGLATQLAPDRESPEAFIERIEQLAAQRRSSSWPRWTLSILLAVALCATVWFAMARIFRSPEAEAVAAGNEQQTNEQADPAREENGNDGNPNATDGDASSPDDEANGPSSGKPPEPEEGNLHNPPMELVSDLPREDVQDVGQVQQEKKPEPIPPFDPQWRLFDDAAARGDFRWASNIDDMLVPLAGSEPERREHNDRIEFQLNGTYRLPPPTDWGRVVRLRFRDQDAIELTCWSNPSVSESESEEVQGVRFAIENYKPLLEAYTVRKPVDDARDTLLPEDTDWRFLRRHVVKRIDPKIDFDWKEGSPEKRIPSDNFAVRWSGKILIDTPGQYRFIGTSDDGVRVYIDGRKVLEHWTDRSVGDSSGDIKLAAGEHDIFVEYYEGSGSSVMQLKWEGPGIKRQVIPSDVFRTSGGPGKKTGLAARYCFGESVKEGGAAVSEYAVQIRRLTDDQGRWRGKSQGAIDLRYQDGQLMVARGDLVYLSVPMERTPTEVHLRMKGELSLAEVLRLPPLEPKNDPPQIVEHERIAPATRQWEVTRNDQAALTYLRDDGGLEFTRRGDANDEVAWFLPVAMRGCGDVILEITAATPETYLAFKHVVDDHRVLLDLRGFGDQMVVAHYGRNGDATQRAAEHGQFVEFPFLLRVRYGIDSIRGAVSADGEHWLEVADLRIPTDRDVSPNLDVGVGVLHGEGDRRIEIAGVRVQRWRTLEHLADPDLIDKVPLEELLEIASIGERLAKLQEKRPDDVEETEWRAAYLAALQLTTLDVKLRRNAALDLVDSAIERGVPTSKILAALAELPLRIDFLDGREPSNNSWQALAARFESLARRETRHGRTENLVEIYQTWRGLDFGHRAYAAYVNAPVAPPDVFRHLAYATLTTGDAAAIRDVALRHLYLAVRRESDLALEGNEQSLKLARWMLSQVTGVLPDTPDVDGIRGFPRIGRIPRHPLAVHADRETVNVISEFFAAVQSGALPHALRILTSRTVPDGIAPVDAAETLYKSTYTMLAEAIEADEQLAGMLQTEYSGLARIRLEQMLAEGRLNDLPAIANQFRGTQAGKEAMMLLADRDLSMGNFFAAAARYEDLLKQELPESERNRIDAKRRLAMAMVGEVQPAASPDSVALPGETFSADAFEKLLKNVAETKQSGHGKATSLKDPLGPGPTKMKVSKLARFGAPPHVRSGAKYDLGLTVEDKRVAVHQHGRLHLVELPGGRVIWKKDGRVSSNAYKVSRPADPLIIADLVITPFCFGHETELAAFSLDKGELRWQQVFDDDVVGEPVLISQWLYVLSIARQRGAYAELNLRRVAPETGESVLVRRLVRLRETEGLHQIGRPTLVGDALIVRSGGVIVCCDLLGKVRWIRRLAYVPESVDGELFDRISASPPAVAGKKVIVTVPGAAEVLCLDSGSGEIVWSRVEPDLRRVVGVFDDRLILATSDRVVAADPASGDTLWSRAINTSEEAMIAGKENTLIVFDLDRNEPKTNRGYHKHYRRLWWYSLADGSEMGTDPRDEFEGEIHGALDLCTNGKWLVGATQVNRDHRAVQLILLEPH